MNGIDLMGQRFGKLIALNPIDSKNGVVWLCQCDCGNMVKRIAGQLRRSTRLTEGNGVSCGCTKHNKTHGQTNTPLYRKWNRMKNRCNNEKNPKYYCYGGRGITVCNDWNKFESFYEWAINNGYKEDLSLERIDVDKNYEPSNCTWILWAEQVHNKRSSRRLTWDGLTMTPRKWSEMLDMPFDALQLRISRKWPIAKIFTQPFRKSK